MQKSTSESFKLIKRIIFLEDELAERPCSQNLKADQTKQNKEESNKQRNVQKSQVVLSQNLCRHLDQLSVDEDFHHSFLHEKGVRTTCRYSHDHDEKKNPDEDAACWQQHDEKCEHHRCQASDENRPWNDFEWEKLHQGDKNDGDDWWQPEAPPHGIVDSHEVVPFAEADVIQKEFLFLGVGGETEQTDSGWK